jgi:hypothetical protein
LLPRCAEWMFRQRAAAEMMTVAGVVVGDVGRGPIMEAGHDSGAEDRLLQSPGGNRIFLNRYILD